MYVLSVDARIDSLGKGKYPEEVTDIVYSRPRDCSTYTLLHLQYWQGSWYAAKAYLPFWVISNWRHSSRT